MLMLGAHEGAYASAALFVPWVASSSTRRSSPKRRCRELWMRPEPCCPEEGLRPDLYRVPEIVTLGRLPGEGESDSRWRTKEVRHVGSDTLTPGF